MIANSSDRTGLARKCVLFFGGVSDVDQKRARYFLLVRFAVHLNGQAQSFFIYVTNIHASLMVEENDVTISFRVNTDVSLLFLWFVNII